jgi:hypothetical protein
MTRLVGITLALVLVAACSSNSGNLCAPQCPNFGPSPKPASATTTATVGSSQTQLSLPAIQAGFGGTITLPPATTGVGATITATLGTSPPNGSPAASSSYGPLAYVAFTVSQMVTWNGTTSVAVSYSGSQPLPSATFFLAFYNGTAWQYDVAGPITSSQNTISFSVPSTGPIAFNAGTTYGFALTTH